MNALVKPVVQVADVQTSIIEFKTERVLLTEQLADFYGTDVKNIQMNYSRNSERFVDGKHFYKVEGDELRELKKSLTNSELVSPNARSVLLWTEKGAARHAKILDTDQAWNVFEQLEECYFTVKALSTNAIALPNFSDPVEAARAWADQVEAKRLACKERDHAIETKAYISDKKTATAMATASVKSKQAEKLKEQLGESKNYASIKAVECKTGKTFKWRELKKWCVENGRKIKDIADANYGTVKIYHKDAWKAVYGVKLTDLFST